ncbi:hypothetical protein [Streptomyces sp. NPDC006638]|uniref:hypothetical protein n=1 Tax=Streptomyces sp. NPDC006638 TaxID=3157183 RepID=UPI0033A0CD40
MELRPEAPAAERRADLAAEAACELVDTAAPGSWSAAVVEDVCETIDTLVRGLVLVDADAARILAAVPAATAALLAQLSPDTADGTVTIPSPRTSRLRRRGLGPGWTGVRTGH